LIDVVNDTYSYLESKYVLGIYLDLQKSYWYGWLQYFTLEIT